MVILFKHFFLTTILPSLYKIKIEETNLLKE